ncbi:MAG: hypothetical protein ABI573_05240 [Chloroflexota bacterium]
MNMRLRRLTVIMGVIVSLVIGLGSVQIAGSLAAAAAPPTAPPVSIWTLKADLEAEQARSASLQEQLNALLTVSESLSAALNTTSDQVNLDGLTADQLRARLVAAQGKLATVTALLGAAQKRLGATSGGTTAGSGGSGGSGGGSSGGTTGAGGGATPAPDGGTTPTPAPTAASPTFTVALVSGGVRLTWPLCTASSFLSYAIVRSPISEMHYPPESPNVLAASVTPSSTTTYVDPVGSGVYYYRVSCLTNAGGEVRVASQTVTIKITVP